MSGGEEWVREMPEVGREKCSYMPEGFQRERNML